VRFSFFVIVRDWLSHCGHVLGRVEAERIA
jgi:hypothetical protein